MAGDPYCAPPSPVSGCLHPDGVAQAEALGRALAAVRIDAAFFGHQISDPCAACNVQSFKICRIIFFFVRNHIFIFVDFAQKRE